jgi:hypothetical protein
MNLGTLNALAAVAVLATPGLAAAVTGAVTVTPLVGTGVHADLVNGATRLLALALRDEGLTVVELEAGAAPAANTQQVRGSILAIGRKAVVEIELVDVAGASVWRGRLTAATPEDLDKVLARLADGLANGRSVQENQDIYSVTDAEARALSREEANSTFGLRISGLSMLRDDTEFLPGFGISWLYDMRSFMIDTTLEYQGIGVDRESFGGLWLSGLFPFSEKDLSPYAGVGLGIVGYERQSTCAADSGFLEDECDNDYDYDADGGAGLGFQGTVGVILGRTRSVNLRAEARYMYGAFEVKGEAVHGLGLGIAAGL